MILDEIIEHKRREIAGCKERESETDLAARADAGAPSRDFGAVLVERGPVAIIAEVKRASPSRGLMVGPDFDPADVARKYELGGAAAISVLTDKRFFQGDEATLRAVRDSVGIPVLRKDFILDPYQVYETRAMGADALLLIVRALDRAELKDLLDLAGEIGLSALVETHSEIEIERALDAGAAIIGVNNRDLDTFIVDLAVTERLAPLVPTDRLVVSESGIAGPEDVARVRDAGARAVLVGESFVTSNNIAERVRELRRAG